MSAFVFSAIAIVAFSAHWHLLGGRIWRALLGAYRSLSKTQAEDRKAGADDRLCDRLTKIRAFNWKIASFFAVHTALAFFVVLMWRFCEEPTVANFAASLLLVIQYIPPFGVVRGMRQTSWTITCTSALMSLHPPWESFFLFLFI